MLLLYTSFSLLAEGFDPFLLISQICENVEMQFSFSDKRLCHLCELTLIKKYQKSPVFLAHTLYHSWLLLHQEVNLFC